MAEAELWGQLAPRADRQPGWLDSEPRTTPGQPKHAAYHAGATWKQRTPRPW